MEDSSSNEHQHHHDAFETNEQDMMVAMPTSSSASHTSARRNTISSSFSNARRPSNRRVQAALITAQICFGLGGVISALGLPACNPFAFALYREIAAGSILLVASHWPNYYSTLCGDAIVAAGTRTASSAPASPSILRQWKRFALLGLALFGNQAGVIAGIKLAGPVAAAVWQPSQPIMTAAICMMLGWEPPAMRRIAGVFISFAGCAVMVILSTKKDSASEHAVAAENDGTGTDTGSDSDGQDPSGGRVLQDLVGHCLFFFNCLCTSLYVLLSKKALLVYPPMKVTAWSYNIAAMFMIIMAYLTSLSDRAMLFLCPDCAGTWTIPTGAVLALAYAIIFNSVIAYALITWSNQFATGTLVIG